MWQFQHWYPLWLPVLCAVLLLSVSVWQLVHQLVLALLRVMLGQLAGLVPRSMNWAAEPWGPWAAGEAASVLWQSEHIMVWVPRLVAQGAFMVVAARALGAALPE